MKLKFSLHRRPQFQVRIFEESTLFRMAFEALFEVFISPPPSAGDPPWPDGRLPEPDAPAPVAQRVREPAGRADPHLRQAQGAAHRGKRDHKGRKEGESSRAGSYE